jgi:peptidoglycan-N-acetylglucosamine deacetylase
VVNKEGQLAKEHPNKGLASCHVDGPSIALTFDDGPSPVTTTQLLDILERRGIKVTFFVIGPNVAAHPEIVRRELADGDEIGNHSWTHPQLSKLSDQRVTEEKPLSLLTGINGSQ